MIERLVATLRQLAALDDGELASPRHAGVRGDCADALRLELDCPQQSLTPAQRIALTRLSDALEADAPAATTGAAVRAAITSLALGSARTV
jgi:hypothetical protein